MDDKGFGIAYVHHAQSFGEHLPLQDSLADGRLVFLIEAVELGKAAVGPGKAALFHHQAADDDAVAGQVFRGGIADDIGAVFKGAQQVGSGKGVVDDQRQSVLMARA